MTSMEKGEAEFVCNGSGGTDASKTMANGGASPHNNGVSSKSETVAPMDPKMLKKWRACQLAGLSVLVVMMWMLLLLPILFYHLPVDDNISESTSTTTPTNTSNSSLLCAPYSPSDHVCTQELITTLISLKCDVEGPLMVQHPHQADTARRLIRGLTILQAPPECVEAVVPLVCTHFLGLCDSSGVSIQPTSGQCRSVRDNLCRDQWKVAAGLFDLPDCDGFPEEQVFCSEHPTSSGSGNSSDSAFSGSGSFGKVSPESNSDLTAVQNTSIRASSSLDCEKDFYSEEASGICVPRCGVWSEYSRVDLVTTDMIILVTAVIGFTASMAVIVLSLIRYKRMFTFPSVFLVYLTFDLWVAEGFIIVTFIDRTALYCTSSNLLESLTNVAPFCVIAGVMFQYTLLQTSIWWLCHTTALLWKIRFPFHSRSFELSRHKTRYLHFACAIFGILIPLVPVIATMASFSETVQSDELLTSRNATFLKSGLGYNTLRFPPVLCGGIDSDAVYYTAIFPINVIVIVGLTELIFLFWTIHKNHGLFKMKKHAHPLKFGAPERKILFTLCYYVFMTVFALTRFTLVVRNSELVKTHILTYFTCESQGANPACDRNSFRQLTHPYLSAISFALIALFPAVNLVYAVNIRELKDMCGRRDSSRERTFTTKRSTVSMNISASTSTNI